MVVGTVVVDVLGVEVGGLVTGAAVVLVDLDVDVNVDVDDGALTEVVVVVVTDLGVDTGAGTAVL